MDDLVSRIIRLCRLSYEELRSLNLVDETNPLCRDADDSLRYAVDRISGNGRAVIRIYAPLFEVYSLELANAYYFTATAYDDDGKIEQLDDLLRIIEAYAHGEFEEFFWQGPRGQRIRLEIQFSPGEESSEPLVIAAKGSRLAQLRHPRWRKAL